MTREEKTALLVDELEDIRCNNFDADTDEDKTLKEAIRVIKALEQGNILDKIRAEIADLDDADYDYEGYYKAVTDAVEIIDRYTKDGE